MKTRQSELHCYSILLQPTTGFNQNAPPTIIHRLQGCEEYKADYKRRDGAAGYYGATGEAS